MKKEVITKKAPRAIGPYSQAVIYGNLIFCSGQIGADPKTGEFVGSDIEVQTRQALTNLKEVLLSAGGNISDIVKVNIYLKNMDDFVKMNSVYAAFFTKPYPARASVEVARLPKGALIEIDCIASVGKKDCCSGNCC